jgi:hypothetical protein
MYRPSNIRLPRHRVAQGPDALAADASSTTYGTEACLADIGEHHGNAHDRRRERHTVRA